MGVFYETIPDSLRPWILEQKLFYVATAPLSPDGHVNVSPKGGPYFGLVDDDIDSFTTTTSTSSSTTTTTTTSSPPSASAAPLFWYLDLSGSGNETISHLREPGGRGRCTVMLAAFDGPPRIVRLWGEGRALEVGTPAFDAFVSRHGEPRRRRQRGKQQETQEEETQDEEEEEEKKKKKKQHVRGPSLPLLPGTRSVIVLSVHQAGTSCGFSVPRFDFSEYRETLNELWARRERQYLRERRRGKGDDDDDDNDRTTTTTNDDDDGNATTATTTDFVSDSMDHYWGYKNAWSMDGLPGMERGMVAARRHDIAPMAKMVGPKAPPLVAGGGRGGGRRGGGKGGSLPVSVVMIIVMAAVFVGLVLGLGLSAYLPVVSERVAACLDFLLSGGASLAAGHGHLGGYESVNVASGAATGTPLR